MAGWIYDYRQELESNIWAMPPMYHRVWQWIKYNVNHSENKIPNRNGTFTIIKPGQRATSYRQIAKGVGYYEGLKWKEPNAKTIKSILDWMVANEMITIEGNSQGTIITIEKWELYQKELPKGNTKETPKKHSLDTNNKRLMNEEGMNNKNIDVDAVLSFHNSLDGLPKYKKLTSARKSIVMARIKEYGIEEVKKTLIKANESSFLRNESGKWYTFDWIYNVNNFVKIYEDNYKDKNQKNKDEIVDF